MIETGNLKLRPPVAADFDGYFALYSTQEDPRIAFMPPLNAEDAWARLLRSIGHWTHFGYGLFVIERRDSGELIGEAGFADFHRGHGPGFDRFPEAGWRIATTHRGQGFATEAMVAAARWLSNEFGPGQTVCMIHPNNAPSLAVAAHLGFREFERATYKGNTIILLATGR
jgi:RimJ/RimL family protein N-acetyltransferase